MCSTTAVLLIRKNIRIPSFPLHYAKCGLNNEGIFKVVLGFWNFGHAFLWVRGDVWRWLCRNLQKWPCQVKNICGIRNVDKYFDTQPLPLAGIRWYMAGRLSWTRLNILYPFPTLPRQSLKSKPLDENSGLPSHPSCPSFYFIQHKFCWHRLFQTQNFITNAELEIKSNFTVKLKTNHSINVQYEVVQTESLGNL